MNFPCDADHKNMKEMRFRPFGAVFDFLSTMFQVMYYLHYRFLRPVLSCVMSGTPGQVHRNSPESISVDFCNGFLKIRTLFECFWHLSKFLVSGKFEYEFFYGVSIDFWRCSNNSS